jgi:hypothetical protein
MAKVFVDFRSHGNVSSADARKIAECAVALQKACEAAGIDSKASIDVSGAGEVEVPAVEEFAVADEDKVEFAAVRTGKPAAKGFKR